MSLAGLGPKSGKSDKGVIDAARPTEGGPAEAGGLSTSSLPWSIDHPARMLDSPQQNLYTKQRFFSTDRA